jgi:hypothetical protein
MRSSIHIGTHCTRHSPCHPPTDLRCRKSTDWWSHVHWPQNGGLWTVVKTYHQFRSVKIFIHDILGFSKLSRKRVIKPLCEGERHYDIISQRYWCNRPPLLLDVTFSLLSFTGTDSYMALLPSPDLFLFFSPATFRSSLSNRWVNFAKPGSEFLGASKPAWVACKWEDLDRWVSEFCPSCSGGRDGLYLRAYQASLQQDGKKVMLTTLHKHNFVTQDV